MEARNVFDGMKRIKIKLMSDEAEALAKLIDGNAAAMEVSIDTEGQTWTPLQRVNMRDLVAVERIRVRRLLDLARSGSVRLWVLAEDYAQAKGGKGAA